MNGRIEQSNETYPGIGIPKGIKQLILNFKNSEDNA